MSGAEQEALARRLRRQAEECCRLGSPLYGELLGRAAGDVETGGAAWEVLRGHGDDAPGSALALRLTGAVNRLVLGGEEVDAFAGWDAFREVLARRRGELRELAEPVEGVSTVVFHSVLVGYLPAAEREALGATIATAGARATAAAPLAWLRLEGPGKLAELRLTTWPGGEERLLGRAGYHGDPIELLECPS